MRLLVPLAALAVVLAVAYAPTPAVASPSAPEVAAADTTWSWPAYPQNLQVLPADIGPDGLRDIMRGFTRALGVRCQFCHVGEEGQDFLEWDFAADDKPKKAIAREMMRMSWTINRETLPAIEGLANPDEAWRVTCYTCHRGAQIPATSADAPPESHRGGNG